jgi:hypothetical protein
VWTGIVLSGIYYYIGLFVMMAIGFKYLQLFGIIALVIPDFLYTPFYCWRIYNARYSVKGAILAG